MGRQTKRERESKKEWESEREEERKWDAVTEREIKRVRDRQKEWEIEIERVREIEKSRENEKDKWNRKSYNNLPLYYFTRHTEYNRNHLVTSLRNKVWKHNSLTAQPQNCLGNSELQHIQIHYIIFFSHLRTVYLDLVIYFCKRFLIQISCVPLIHWQLCAVYLTLKADIPQTRGSFTITNLSVTHLPKLIKGEEHRSTNRCLHMGR